MSNQTPNSKIAEILVQFSKMLAASSGTYNAGKVTEAQNIAHDAQVQAATQLQQLMIEARIDEWDYIETLRELSDNAMYVSMDDRIKELQAQLNKEVE